jgi:predicted metal-dependent hydrolase
MESQIRLGDITVEVVLKRIRNINLTVLPPAGRVRISAPTRTSMHTIRAFAASNIDWIKKQRARLREHERRRPRGYVEPRSRYVDGESHPVWGRRHRLAIREADERPSVRLTRDRLVLRVRPRTKKDARQALIEKWYRDELRAAVQPMLRHWERRLGVKVEHLYVRRMKTRWGSCNPDARTIRLNTELATRPPEQLEYIVVHELVHLIEPTHNARFHALMDRYMPDWKRRREALSRPAVRQLS